MRGEGSGFACLGCPGRGARPKCPGPSCAWWSVSFPPHGLRAPFPEALQPPWCSGPGLRPSLCVLGVSPLEWWAGEGASFVLLVDLRGVSVGPGDLGQRDGERLLVLPSGRLLLRIPQQGRSPGPRPHALSPPDADAGTAPGSGRSWPSCLPGGHGKPLPSAPGWGWDSDGDESDAAAEPSGALGAGRAPVPGDRGVTWGAHTQARSPLCPLSPPYSAFLFGGSETAWVFSLRAASAGHGGGGRTLWLSPHCAPDGASAPCSREACRCGKVPSPGSVSRKPRCLPARLP